MPSINMIAPRRAEKKRLESNIRKLLLVIIVEIAVVVSISGLLVTRVYRTQTCISNLDKQLAKLQPTVDKIKNYEKSTKELEPKLEVLNKAKADTSKWCRILHDLSISLPEKTWLTRFSTSNSQKSETIIVNLNGMSSDQSQVGQTMLRIHDMVADLENVDLNYTKKLSNERLDAVEFEVVADIKSEKKADKEVEKS